MATISTRITVKHAYALLFGMLAGVALMALLGHSFTVNINFNHQHDYRIDRTQILKKKDTQ